MIGKGTDVDSAMEILAKLTQLTSTAGEYRVAVAPDGCHDRQPDPALRDLRASASPPVCHRSPLALFPDANVEFFQVGRSGHDDLERRLLRLRERRLPRHLVDIDDKDSPAPASSPARRFIASVPLPFLLPARSRPHASRQDSIEYGHIIEREKPVWL